MSNRTVEPSDVVLLHHHRGDTTSYSNGLVLDVDFNNPGTDGGPALEVVSVNPRGLRHAGTSDWHNALTRSINVVHISHPDFTGGRVELGYEQTTVVNDVPEDQEFVYGAEGQSGAWTDLGDGYTEGNPDHPAPPSATPAQPIRGSRKGKKESPLFTLVVNGEQVGDAFPGFTAMELLDGSPIIATVVKAGDTLKDNVLVDHVGPGVSDNTMQITASKL